MPFWVVIDEVDEVTNDWRVWKWVMVNYFVCMDD